MKWLIGLLQKIDDKTTVFIGLNMSVCVEPSRWPYQRMIICHLDVESHKELHIMVDKIGI